MLTRLVAISGPGVTASFVYDPLGRRISKTVNGVTTEYLYDGNDVVREIQGGAVAATYLRSLNIDEPFVRLSASGNEYYHTDALGSAFVLTDDSGSATVSYSYDAFGKTTSAGASQNPFQYTGRENDGTGLYYYRARYYGPSFARFIGEDPILAPLTPLTLGLCRRTNLTVWLLPARLRTPVGDNSAQSLDAYAYVKNNPLSGTDPTGLDPKDDLPCQGQINNCVQATKNISTRSGGTVGNCIAQGMASAQYGRQDCARISHKGKRIICTGAVFATVTSKCINQAAVPFQSPKACRADVMTTKCLGLL